jgi:hypothetical protein
MAKIGKKIGKCRALLAIKGAEIEGKSYYGLDNICL